MRIFFSVGEPSGDLHGANLIAQLKERSPQVECVGYGGPRMEKAGCTLHADLTRLAIMWFVRVLLNIHTFWLLYRRAKRYFAQHRPDAVVLIDYPGFNWWIARAAKAHGIPVFYYGTPQIWAWATWRIHKMRRLVDHVLCKLPFEAAWYRDRGCNATYVGHPYFDQTRSYELDEAFLAEQRTQSGRLVAILPGSRTQEVTSNFRWFLRAAEVVHAELPETRFAVAAFNEKQAELVREKIGRTQLPIDVFVGRTPELIHLAECCMACSGSVSLELLYHTKPTVILYWITRVAMFVQLFFRRVKYITLVNLLTTDNPRAGDGRPFNPDAPGAEPIPFPEYLTCGDKSNQIAAHLVRWLTDPAELERRVEQLAELKARVGHGGASRVAATYILDVLERAEHGTQRALDVSSDAAGPKRRSEAA